MIGNLLLINAMGQDINLDHNVKASGGGFDSTSTLIISSTVGEAVISTLTPQGNNVALLTQGFQQSIVGDNITVTITTNGALCFGRNDGFAVIDSISGCTGPYTIFWSSGATGNRASNLAAGNYTVDITAADNCFTSAPFTIGYVNELECLLKFYSGITPNADGFNDQWEIDNIELFPDNEVKIYNRLGNKVWDGKNYNNSTVVWKGENLSGNELPSDTYFYVFESGSNVENGWIELTR